MPRQHCRFCYFSVEGRGAFKQTSYVNIWYVSKDIWRGSPEWLGQRLCLLEILGQKTKGNQVIFNMTGTNTEHTLVSLRGVRILTQGDVCDDTAKYERCQKRERNDEAVEKAVIAFAHAVPHPRAVVIKSFCG